MLCYLLIFSQSVAQIKEPYQILSRGKYSGVPVKASPDPLITYRWEHLTKSNDLY